jgi:gas vesicle protein
MIASLWSRFYGWLLGALAVIGGVLAIYLRGRSSGKKREQEKITKRDLDTERERAQRIQEATNVSNDVNRLPASAVEQRLRDEWSRD